MVMKTKSTLALFLLFAVPGLLLTGCGTEGEGTPDFDREEMLLHYSANVIKPAFQGLQQEAENLDSQVGAFVDAPSAAALGSAKAAWLSAYAAWQSANAFNFGPAGEDGLRKGLIEEVGTWPVAVGKVENAITAADHSLSGFDRDARGFLAIEYLLFGGGEAEVLQQYEGSSSRRAHLKALTADVLARVQDVNEAWEGYEAEFVSNNGTDAGSSTSRLYNEWVRSFESAKNFKVGLPAGKRPGQVQSEPQLVEAFYSATSLAQLKAHLQAIEDIYYGGGEGNRQGPSLKTYLDNVVGGTALIAESEAQWANVMAALEAVPEGQPFRELIAAEDPTVEALHTELQRQTRFFKSDMSSLLGIAITFSSGDGD